MTTTILTDALRAQVFGLNASAPNVVEWCNFSDGTANGDIGGGGQNWDKIAQLIKGGGRNGGNAVRIVTDDTVQIPQIDGTGGKNVRVHGIGFKNGLPPWFANDHEVWLGYSLKILSGYDCPYECVTAEIHGDNGTGPAPLNACFQRGSSPRLICRGSTAMQALPTGFPFEQNVFGAQHGTTYDGTYYRHAYDWQGGNVPVDQLVDGFLDLRIGRFLSLDPALGWFQAFAIWPGVSTWQEIVPKMGGIRTTYQDVNGDGNAVYPMMSSYYQVGSGKKQGFEVSAGAWGDSLAGLGAWQDARIGVGSPVVVPDPTTATSSVQNGDALVGVTAWTVTVAGPGTDVEFFVNGASVGTVPIANGRATYVLDPAKQTNVANGGFHVLANGTVVYRSSSIAFTLAPPIPVKDIVSVAIASQNGTYHVSGKRTDGKPVSWTGANRTNAVAALEKFLARLG